MRRIAILPPSVQGQIAAGEVIERPASVVKELVENALDAGARHVDVRLAGGGLDAIVVQDDGSGMEGDEALLAFARHATSKLESADELAGIATLGFRGEALPSIAAVARVRVVTRRAGEAVAAVVEADANGARAAGVAGAAPGTTFEVRDLFGATPARRKFLRTPSTEVGQVVDVLTRLAVAAPAVGFRLEHEGREVLSLPPVRDLGQRVGQVLGRERATTLVPFEAVRGGMQLSGLLGPPRDTVGSARLVWTYVAIGAEAVGRWVRDRLLLRAVLDGYESLLLRGRYPVAVVFLRLPPGEIDVNVHPAKLEVRFQRSSAVHQLIVPAIRSRLTTGLAAARASEPGAPGEPLPWEVREPETSYAAGDAPAPPVQAGLWAPVPRGFASLRFIGQIFDGYLLCEGDARIVLIDQHAAHERVVFERLRAEQARGEVAVDRLLVPEAIALPAAQASILAEHADALAAAGLEGEPFGDGTFLLRTVPRGLRGRDAGAVLRGLAEELLEHGASAAASRATDAVLATVACHSVVRVGQRLDDAEVRALLDAMDGVEIAAHCPHGRPVAAELTRGQLEGFFPPMSARPRLVCLVGPTAAGKTALGVTLAERLDAEIVSADSRQVYRGLDIGTAKPTAAERARVPHHGLDLVEPGAPFDAARFRAVAATAIADIHRRGRQALVVGGTGLYVRALLHGLCPAPPRVPALRAALTRMVAARGAAVVHRGLVAFDPVAAARIAPNDAVRVVRALEVGMATGVRLSAWQAAHRFAESSYDVLVIGLARPPLELTTRIVARADAMVAAGWLDEVRAVRQAGLAAGAPGLGAIGYAEMLAHLDGDLDLPAAITRTVLATRRFAKRQRTWFRSEPGILWRHPETDAARIAAEMAAFLATGVRPASAAA